MEFEKSPHYILLWLSNIPSVEDTTVYKKSSPNNVLYSLVLFFTLYFYHSFFNKVLYDYQLV